MKSLYNIFFGSRIPKDIYVCYKDKNIPDSVIKNIKDKNPGWTVHFYDDNECYQYILENHGDKLAKLFKSIPDGPIRADLWRVCIY